MKPCQLVFRIEEGKEVIASYVFRFSNGWYYSHLDFFTDGEDCFAIVYYGYDSKYVNLNLNFLECSERGVQAFVELEFLIPILSQKLQALAVQDDFELLKEESLKSYIERRLEFDEFFYKNNVKVEDVPIFKLNEVWKTIGNLENKKHQEILKGMLKASYC